MSEANKDNYNLGQRMRSEYERGLPEWEIMEIDRRRSDMIRNRVENPAIWQKLTEIEHKLDSIFALLQHHPHSQHQHPRP